MKNPTRPPTLPLRNVGAAAPLPQNNNDSVFQNFNVSIENSTYAIYDLMTRVNNLADQARGPVPVDGVTGDKPPPTTEAMLLGLERAIGSLREAVNRLDNA